MGPGVGEWFILVVIGRSGLLPTSSLGWTRLVNGWLVCPGPLDSAVSPVLDIGRVVIRARDCLEWRSDAKIARPERVGERGADGRDPG
jgi:hypothetical protein